VALLTTEYLPPGVKVAVLSYPVCGERITATFGLPVRYPNWSTTIQGMGPFAPVFRPWLQVVSVLGLSVTGLGAVLTLLDDRPPIPPEAVPPSVVPPEIELPPTEPPELEDRLPPPATLEPPDWLELLAPAELLDLEPPPPAPPEELELDCPPEVTPPELVPPAEPPELPVLPPDDEVQPKAASAPRRARLARPGRINRFVSVFLLFSDMRLVPQRTCP
jgi:hypothetical protein